MPGHEISPSELTADALDVEKVRLPPGEEVQNRLFPIARMASVLPTLPGGMRRIVMDSSGLLEAFIGLRSALLRYLALQGASPEEAEDILQDAGLKLVATALPPVTQPRAYLYRMVHNFFVLHRRSASRRSRRDEAWVSVHAGDPPHIDETPSAEASLIARQQLAILQEALDSLPERTRTIFRRFRLENAQQRQIAAEQGISVSAVEKHLARAYHTIAARRRKMDGAAGTSRHPRVKEGRHGQ